MNDPQILVTCPHCNGACGFGQWDDPEHGFEDCYSCGGTGEVTPFEAASIRAARIADMADDKRIDKMLGN